MVVVKAMVMVMVMVMGVVMLMVMVMLMVVVMAMVMVMLMVVVMAMVQLMMVKNIMMDNIRDKVDALRKMFGQMGAAAGEQVRLSSYFQVQLHLQGSRHNYI